MTLKLDNLPRLTREQAAILTLFTGITCDDRGMDGAKELAEHLMGRPIYTHEYASRKLADELKELTRPLFGQIVHLTEEAQS